MRCKVYLPPLRFAVNPPPPAEFIVHFRWFVGGKVLLSAVWGARSNRLIIFGLTCLNLLSNRFDRVAYPTIGFILIT